MMMAACFSFIDDSADGLGDSCVAQDRSEP